VFKVERGPAGEKIAYVRPVLGTVWCGTACGRPHEECHRPSRCSSTPRPSGARRSPPARSQALGLGEVRVGDQVGVPRPAAPGPFDPPTLETVVVPARPARQGPRTWLT
jgi:ribosomal protection tetracycline resistance protein